MFTHNTCSPTSESVSGAISLVISWIKETSWCQEHCLE